jgi:hypothetical protein
MSKILFINNSGSGFAAPIEVADGMTLGALFAEKMPGADPHDYLIRLDRQPACADEVLRDGCRVSITPSKIEGAAQIASVGDWLRIRGASR